MNTKWEFLVQCQEGVRWSYVMYKIVNLMFVKMEICNILFPILNNTKLYNAQAYIVGCLNGV